MMQRNNQNLGSNSGILSADGAAMSNSNFNSSNSNRLISPYQDEASKFMVHKAQTARSPPKPLTPKVDPTKIPTITDEKK